MSDTVIARFAPSPTGLIHLGNMRTALFNFLYANSQSGEFHLRIEDTDKERSTIEFQEKLLKDLFDLGIKWSGGEQDYLKGFIRQSDRTEIYEEYFNKLIEKGYAYDCFCTPEDLDRSRKSQLRSGKAPMYAGTCRNLTKEQIEEKLAAGIKPTLRFNVSKCKKVIFEDLIQGKKTFNVNDIGDFIIRKSDGSPSFFFSNALDDALCGINCALRGEDHITNTPRQLFILKALKLREPEYGHLPLIVGNDGKPLSKRNGSMSVHQCLEAGILPLALLNYLARLGHKYADNGFLSLEQLCKQFNIKNVGRSPAKFDLKQLEHWQKEAIAAMSKQEFFGWAKHASEHKGVVDVSKVVPAYKLDLFFDTVKHNVTEDVQVAYWAEQIFTEVKYTDEAKELIENLEKSFIESLLAAINEHGTDYKAVVASVKESTGKTGKNLFMPIRALVTGTLKGPELVNVFNLLGKEKLIEVISKHLN